MPMRWKLQRGVIWKPKSRMAEKPPTDKSLMRLTIPHPGADETAEIQGEITAWYANRRQPVSRGDLLYQITWPGMVIDIPCPADGILISRKTPLRCKVLPEQHVADLQVSAEEPDD